MLQPENFPGQILMSPEAGNGQEEILDRDESKALRRECVFTKEKYPGDILEFEKALETRPRDGFCITGIVRVTESRAIPGSLYSTDFFWNFRVG